MKEHDQLIDWQEGESDLYLQASSALFTLLLASCGPEILFVNFFYRYHNFDQKFNVNRFTRY